MTSVQNAKNMYWIEILLFLSFLFCFWGGINHSAFCVDSYLNNQKRLHVTLQSGITYKE